MNIHTILIGLILTELKIINTPIKDYHEFFNKNVNLIKKNIFEALTSKSKSIKIHFERFEDVYIDEKIEGILFHKIYSNLNTLSKLGCDEEYIFIQSVLNVIPVMLECNEDLKNTLIGIFKYHILANPEQSKFIQKKLSEYFKLTF